MINKTLLFVTRVVYVAIFLRWLKQQTGGDGSARMQGDKLVLVPNIADCFSATVRVLRSIDPSNEVAFHNYSLPEDRCPRFLIKDLGKNWKSSEFQFSRCCSFARSVMVLTLQRPGSPQHTL